MTECQSLSPRFWEELLTSELARVAGLVLVDWKA